MEVWAVSEAPGDGGCEMKTPYPNFNIAGYHGGRGTPTHRYAMSKRGPVVTPTTDPLADLWWRVSPSVPPVTADTLDVSCREGRLYRPEISWPSIYGQLPSLYPAESYTVATTVKEDIQDGDQLWIKITWGTEEADPETDDADTISYARLVDETGAAIVDYNTSTDGSHDHAAAVGADGDHNHTVSLALGSALGDQLLIAAELRSRAITMTAATYEIYTTAVAATLGASRLYSYIHVATFAVTDDVLSISQRIVGCPITVYPLIFTYGAGTGD